jgi:Uncharacterised nucleotidyltransferase
MRDHQRQLVTAVLAELRGQRAEPLTMTLDQFRLAGLATGLTALLGELGTTTSRPAAEDAAIHRHIAEQGDQVRARVERFQQLKARVIDAFAAADVPAVFVKGAELIDGVWPYPLTRPMADLDVVVLPHLRAQAGAALVAAGCPWWTSTAYEDAFLGWGDGSTGRLDGESAEHNGRVEVHPGWLEFVHGYEVTGFDVIGTAQPIDGRLRLPLDALTAQVVGHLSATVVRAEVRALNTVDTLFCDRRGADWHHVSELLDRADPRLAAPGLWLVDRLIPGMVPGDVVAAQMQRLPATARRLLEATEPHAVFRDPNARTTFGWRQAFTIGPRERVRVVEQMVWPSPHRSIGATVERVAARGRGARLAT